MGMNITKGIQKTFLKCVLHGVEGIGKTTFGSKTTKPLFIDLENGTNQLAVDRIKANSYTEVRQIIANLQKNTGGYQTLIIDTADWLEKLMCQYLIAQQNVSSIEEIGKGYGKGWTMVMEEWHKFLDQVNKIQMDIIFLAHTEVKPFNIPEECGSFDRYTLRMSKKGNGVLTAWPDLLLFANYKVMVSVNEKNKMEKNKAQGNRRVMYTSRTASWDAKNRFSLKPELPFDFKEVKHIFNQVSANPATATKTTTPAKEAIKKAEVKVEATTAPAPSDNPKVAELRTLLEMSGVSEAEVEAQMVKVGAYPEGTKIISFSDSTLNKIINGWEQISGMIQAGKTEALVGELEALMKADGIEAAQVEAKVVEKKKGSGPYTGYSADLLTFLIGGWEFLAKAIKGE
jgi:AAA domain